MSDQTNPTTPTDKIRTINDCNISRINTGEVLNDLNDLFKKVMSGEPYNKDQVRHAAGVTNAMIKVLRFEFDAFKYFDGRLNK